MEGSEGEGERGPGVSAENDDYRQDGRRKGKGSSLYKDGVVLEQ